MVNKLVEITDKGDYQEYRSHFMLNGFRFEYIVLSAIELNTHRMPNPSVYQDTKLRKKLDYLDEQFGSVQQIPKPEKLIKGESPITIWVDKTVLEQHFDNDWDKVLTKLLPNSVIVANIQKPNEGYDSEVFRNNMQAIIEEYI